MHLFFIASLFLAITTACAAPATRIVAVGSGVTETIYALQADDRLVGVDQSSDWPAAARNQPQIGYQRTLAAEGILALKPDLVIGTEQAGPPATLAQLRAGGVEVVILPEQLSLEGVAARITQVASLVGKPAAGQALWQNMQRDLAKAQSMQPPITSRKRVLVLLAVPGRAPLAAGKATAADLVLTVAAADNVVTDFTGYRVLSPEAIQLLDPEVIIITDEGARSGGGLVGIRDQPGIKHTQAAKNAAIYSLDTNFLLSLGPRFGEAVLQVTRLLYSPVS